MKIYSATIPAEMLRLKPREAYYARQKQLFILVFIGVSVVPLFMVTWYSSRHYQESWLARTSTELVGIAASRREIINLFLDDRESQLAGVAGFASLERLASQDELERLFTQLAKDGVITDLGIIDQAGNHRAYVGPFAAELAGKNYADTPWFREVMTAGSYISDTFSGYRKVPHVIVAVADAKREWILRATINSELFNSLVASANVGEGGDAFIINRNGALQTPSRRGRAAVTEREIATLSGIAEAATPRRLGNHLYMVAPLRDGRWLLVLEADSKAALAEFAEASRFGLAIAGIGSLGIASVAFFLVGSMMNRLARADRQRMDIADNVRQVEKMALVGRLAASVAHEINNPLQIITDQAGWMDELLDDETPEKVVNLGEYRESIAKIRRQVKRAGVITHRLLGFSRLRDDDRAPTDINRVVEETVALLENEARNHQIRIQRNYAADLPQVSTDVSQLQQVFLNILNNAMDAIGQQGSIEVATSKEGGRVLVRLADSGPGMPEELLGKVFDSFFTTKQKGKGTGLGLSISHNIMQRLGGAISVANRPEGGCVFTVSLPCLAGQAEEPMAKAC
ncbi:MAG: sensor histidine kinase [Thermodesulfobacteriota bacterium]